MTDIKEIQTFVEMAELYDQVGEDVSVDQSEDIEDISKLSNAGEYSAIDVLYNDDSKEKAEDIFVSYFGVELDQLNRWADFCGYTGVYVKSK